jgi:hypothetical protein
MDNFLRIGEIPATVVNGTKALVGTYTGWVAIIQNNFGTRRVRRQQLASDKQPGDIRLAWVEITEEVAIFRPIIGHALQARLDGGYIVIALDTPVEEGEKADAI